MGACTRGTGNLQSKTENEHFSRHLGTIEVGDGYK